MFMGSLLHVRLLVAVETFSFCFCFFSLSDKEFPFQPPSCQYLELLEAESNRLGGPITSFSEACAFHTRSTRPNDHTLFQADDQFFGILPGVVCTSVSNGLDMKSTFAETCGRDMFILQPTLSSGGGERTVNRGLLRLDVIQTQFGGEPNTVMMQS